jgi:phage/plasmid primase-like uncharacterized protein
MTAADIKTVARRLLGEPNRALSTKTELRHGRKGSLAIDLDKGVWFDHEIGEGGGVLDLICRENSGSHREARARLRDELGLATNSTTNRSTTRTTLDNDEARNRRFALETWAASSDADRTEVETCLHCRGIRIPIPPSLRFHADLKHYHTGLFFPTMVAGVQDADGKVIAVHRTFLQPGGRGKAQVNRPKMVLGTLDDGAVRLAPAEKALGLAEGIETALSAMQLFEIPVWAALSCGRFASVAIPDDVVELQIFADNGAEGLEAADRAARHFASLGKRVFVRPPHPRFSDWNDALREIGP